MTWQIDLQPQQLRQPLLLRYILPSIVSELGLHILVTSSSARLIFPHCSWSTWRSLSLKGSLFTITIRGLLLSPKMMYKNYTERFLMIIRKHYEQITVS